VAKPPPPADLKRKFGQAVQGLRHDLDVSQEELAARAEIHRTYLGDIERGNRNPALINICRIAAALEIKPSELFHRMGL
jgi:transcriptional regulator with XRE-family HTH domain